MKTSIQIKPSRELAYWVGVVQSDGYLDKYFNKKRRLKLFRISLCVSKKSLQMLKRFQEISQLKLQRKTKIFTCKNNVFKGTIGIKELLKEFEKLDIKFGDPPNPPKWVRKNINFFGAYLGGLIDGDGNVTVIEKKCEVRIASRHKPAELKKVAEKFLTCKVRIYDKVKNSGCYYLCFLISSKNFEFIKNFVLPNILITYKKKKVKNFINSRYSV